MTSSRAKVAGQDLLEHSARPPTAGGRRVRTTSEIQEYLTTKHSRAQQRFHQALARLDVELQEALARTPKPNKRFYIDAASRYLGLLGQYHGNRLLTGALRYSVREQWLGWPIVSAWDGVGHSIEHWDLVAQVWIHPEGMCWEAREAKSATEERLDAEHRIAYYKHTEPYTGE